MKPHYSHLDGTFAAPDYFVAGRFVVTEGLLAFSNPELRDMFDVRVYLDPPEELRRHWKVQRDCSRRGYTTDQVLSELDRREPDSEAFIRPQRHHADIVVSFQPGDRGQPGAPRLQAHAPRHAPAPRPDRRRRRRRGRPDAHRAAGRQELCVPGRIDPSARGAARGGDLGAMHFARHLRSDRLGEFTIGTELHRSDSLALVQLLILYHVVTARAVVSLGGGSARDFDLSTLEQLVANEQSTPF